MAKVTAALRAPQSHISPGLRVLSSPPALPGSLAPLGPFASKPRQSKAQAGSGLLSGACALGFCILYFPAWLGPGEPRAPGLPARAPQSRNACALGSKAPKQADSQRLAESLQGKSRQAAVPNCAASESPRSDGGGILRHKSQSASPGAPLSYPGSNERALNRRFHQQLWVELLLRFPS